MPQNTKDKEFLIKIVRTWTPSETPEFRGFRCGVCQNLLENKAWHHKLDSAEYAVTVHLCDNCQKLSNIEEGLPASEAGEYKAFSCDQCSAEVVEAWHIWSKQGNKLAETHLCKTCASKSL